MKIPAIINKSELARELGITKQALSERIKRGLSEAHQKEIINIFKKHLTEVK